MPAQLCEQLLFGIRHCKFHIAPDNKNRRINCMQMNNLNRMHWFHMWINKQTNGMESHFSLLAPQVRTHWSRRTNEEILNEIVQMNFNQILIFMKGSLTECSYLNWNIQSVLSSSLNIHFHLFASLNSAIWGVSTFLLMIFCSFFFVEC